MPKVSARFRNRKINFRTRITIHTGPLDTPSDHEEDDYPFEDDRRQSIGGPATDRSHIVETGVDKEEESELHLQKVINASTAALMRSAVNQRKPASPGLIAELADTAAHSTLATQSSTTINSNNNTAPNDSNVPHIPIPDAAGLVDPATYEALYAHSKIFLPSSYIRFSDTVEDTLGGVVYTMDEEDEAWLNRFNSENNAPHSDHNHKGGSTPDENGKNRRTNSRKGKEKERSVTETDGPGHLAEDDFEAIMDHFEKTTEETVPGLHLDTNRLPSLADLEPSLESPLISQRLSSVKIFAKFVYSHWKERRLKRGGKPIMPAVDFDETNESNPYVCFRRREIKMVRKTRRTDTQNMDRLVRLRNDLYKAQELLNTVLARERTKREAVELEKAIFEGRCLIREMKRSLNEADGDEELLVSKKEKRRKREQSGNGTLKSPLRNAAGPSLSGTGSAGASVLEDVQFYRDQARASTKLMERDYNRCREEQNGWEDLTDSAHLPMPLSAAALRWRGAVSSDPHLSSKSNREATVNFEQGLSTAPSVMEHNQFRKRVGRGGRLFLDRIVAPRQRRCTRAWLDAELAGDSEESARDRRLTDRWRYDDDLRQDFPSTDYPHIIDDYNVTYSARRSQLLDQDDLQYLDPPGEVYLAKVAEYYDRAPQPEPTIVKVGKLPSKVVPNLYGAGLGCPTFPSSGPAVTMPEQLLAAHASAQVPNLRLNPTGKRATPNGTGPAVNRTPTSTQASTRTRKNPSVNGSPTANANAKSSSLQGQPPIQQMVWY
ncbi:Enhancer of polycomb-like protein 1 [Puccinia graminis f. sp. tritici]|uniref:Enhancer of polycomb-like protein n=2 Tax=Puccinia graminis f. sp. tritici TaxID=56615 RepID=E3L324_PUCGT|nr:uncharacterized protein PGTG_17221 [Puccinia graminis f. sp. tritici CRL 75-36-700-3]EFP90949.1 hypothetical protein PGTG_17221 [Puccinia graminis f. sp. tritici CRL 75-36-700-3]KAA1112577.1 Enhancer of polycomb-like protein 1 [Puccinia graminis f. sp. tritici]KAA1134772.1 Enhancer of polycomb-like protein 1 [Puccinia graminis f. sp. tritici]